MGFIVKCDVCGTEKASFPGGRRMPDDWHEGVVDGLATELDVEVICPECVEILGWVIRFWKPIRAVAMDLFAKEPDCNLSEDERAARRLAEPIAGVALKYGSIYPGGKKIEPNS